jgi:hypothetical protein
MNHKVISQRRIISLVHSFILQRIFYISQRSIRFFPGRYSHGISDCKIFWPEHQWKDTILSKCAYSASQLVSYEFYSFAVSFQGLFTSYDQQGLLEPSLTRGSRLFETSWLIKEFIEERHNSKFCMHLK